jgi:hypothetical protein
MTFRKSLAEFTVDRCKVKAADLTRKTACGGEDSIFLPRERIDTMLAG